MGTSLGNVDGDLECVDGETVADLKYLEIIAVWFKYVSWIIATSIALLDGDERWSWWSR